MNLNTKIGVPSSIKRRDKGDAWRRYLRRNTMPTSNTPSWMRSTAPSWSHAH